jgi:hypothetical protein
MRMCVLVAIYWSMFACATHNRDSILRVFVILLWSSNQGSASCLTKFLSVFVTLAVVSVVHGVFQCFILLETHVMETCI